VESSGHFRRASRILKPADSTPTANFHTADGKANLFCVDCEPFPEQPNASYPLVLTRAEPWSTGTPAPRPAACRFWSHVAAGVAGDEPARRAKAELASTRVVDIVSRRNRVRGVELRVTEIVAPDRCSCVSLCGDEFTGHAERIRPISARAEL